MRDMPVYLPGDTYLKALAIDADFKTVSELMQRALILILCVDDSELLVNGKHIMEFLEQTTNSAVSNIAPMLSDIADAITRMLNDGYNDGRSEAVVRSVYFTVTVDSGIAAVNLFIQPVDDEPESMVIYKYE
jgi:hypothetical protein